MTLRTLSFHIAASAGLFAQQGAHFSAKDAIRAEWDRKPPVFTEAQRGQLSSADRARLDLTLKRIGAPGAPELLPPGLASPTLEIWLQKAPIAKTPQERFTALFFLNRFKSPRALEALNGLSAEDARTWPKHLHLEAGIASARLNGGEVSTGLQSFLDALQKAGKVDPVRAQAARLRLVMGGKEKALLPAVQAGPGAVLSLVDSWNRSKRPEGFNWTEAFTAKARLSTSVYPTFLEGTEWKAGAPSSEAAIAMAGRLDELMWVRFAEAQPTSLGENLAPYFSKHWTPAANPVFRFWTLPVLSAFSKAGAVQEAQRLVESLRPVDLGALLPALRKIEPQLADQLRVRLLNGPDSIPRAAAIEDLPSAPDDLQAFTSRVWNDTEFEPQQTLIQSYARWKMAPEDQKAQLRPWLQHPDWACRWEAYQALRKLDLSTPWPDAPAPTKEQASILHEAEKLAATGKTVRLRITFEGKRIITLRLDPAVAPINVANLVHLAKKGFFNGRRVPRVVPDFVVQMGSPYDTMDGGPGYSVRCEDSLNWYGPGSVGMALGGKDTGGSQFFITTNATPHLTGKYTRVGEVEDLDHAMPVLDDLELGAKILRIDVLTR